MIALCVLLGLLLLAYTAYAVLSVWAAWKWSRPRRPLAPDWTPPVTLLKPVRGVDVEAYTSFASFCQQDYPVENVQIVFGVLDADDPAIAAIERLQTDFPERAITLVIGGPEARQGHNLKVCNLRAMLPAAKHDLLVLTDSDMRVTPDYLRRVVAPFEGNDSELGGRGDIARESGPPAVGLVTCPYRGHLSQGLPAALEALGIGADFIPSALVSAATEGVSFAFGSTIALPRRVLTELGGFEAIKDQLADDFRLGNGTANAGYRVVLSDYVVDDMLGRETFRAMWARRLRWAKTTRSCRPVGYAGSVVTFGTALALLFLLATGFSLLGWSVFVAVLLLRLTTALLISQAFTRDPNIRRFLPLLLFSDLFSFALFAASFVGNHIVWRGVRFRLYPGGRIERTEKS